MKKTREFIPLALMLVSLPFYFVGLFSLKNENGVRIMGTLKFLSLGITGEYGDYYMYFYQRGPKFINAILVMLVISLLMFIVFAFIHLLRKDEKKLKAYVSLTFMFSLLAFAAYVSAIMVLVFFYTNRLHASYIIQGSSTIGFGAILGVLLQFSAVLAYSLNWVKYVLTPFIENHRKARNGEEDEEENVPQQNPAQPLQRPVGQPNTAIPVALQNPVSPYAVMQNVPKGVIGVVPNTVQPRPPVVHPVPPKKCSHYLIISNGSMKGGKIALHPNERIIIGKDPSKCTLVIDQKYTKVSRVHCTVVRKDNDFYIKDHNSTNGTYFSKDNKRIPAGVLTKLEYGQRFNLAKTDNEFYCQVK